VSIAGLALVIGKLLAFVAVGAALRGSGLLSVEDARPINAVIVYVGIPALIFQAVHPARLSWELAVVAGVAWGVALVGFGLAYVAARLLKLSRPAAGGLMLTAALGNTGYVGYPVALAILGSAGLVKAVFYDVFGTVAALLTVGVAVAATFGRTEERPNVLREFLTFPAVIALLAGLVLKPVAVPIPVSEWLDALAKLVVPLIMISLGLSFRPRALGTYALPVAVVAGIKLLLLPLVALVLGRAVLGDPDAVRLVVLQAGMPTMMLSLVFGARFRLDVDLIASAALVTTAVAIVSIPLMQTLVR
jgi:malate permease and related proteins